MKETNTYLTRCGCDNCDAIYNATFFPRLEIKKGIKIENVQCPRCEASNLRKF